MSILIKGMEMPNTCYECDFCQHYVEPNQGYYCVALFADLHRTGINNERNENCPLIKVPTPHGDLIDRDALMKDGWLCLHKEVMRMGGYAIHELPLANPSIPVVIEKENC